MFKLRMGNEVLQKPAWPFKMDLESCYTKGLALWLPAGPTGVMFDPITGTMFPSSGGGKIVGGVTGPALECLANDQGVQLAAPTSICGLTTVTLIAFFSQISTPNSNGAHLEISFTNANTTPFNQYTIQCGGTATNLQLSWNNAGSSTNISATGKTPANGTLFNVLVGTIQHGAQQLWLNGESIATGANALASVSVGAAPLLSIGCSALGTLRTIGALVHDVRLYNRVLTDDEIKLLSNPAGMLDLYAAA